MCAAARGISCVLGISALLNSCSVAYPLSTAQVISEVNTALASCDRATMITEATRLDGFNNLPCPLGGPAPALSLSGTDSRCSTQTFGRADLPPCLFLCSSATICRALDTSIGIEWHRQGQFVCLATATWAFTDQGERGSSDATIVITDADCNLVLDVRVQSNDRVPRVTEVASPSTSNRLLKKGVGGVARRRDRSDRPAFRWRLAAGTDRESFPHTTLVQVSIYDFGRS